MTKLKLLCISGPRSIRRATGPFFFFLESAFVTRSMYVATRLDLDHCRAVPCDRFLFSTSFSFPRRNGAARVCQPSQDDISFSLSRLHLSLRLAFANSRWTSRRG